MPKSHDDDLFSRNAPFVGTATQARLSRIRVGLVGCGLASQIALALARLGVKRFWLWDFDSVELSNLNRQAFLEEHEGMNKAAATADLLQRFSSTVTIGCVEERFLPAHLESVLPGLDVVVNSIDFDDPLVYDVSDTMQRSQGWCIQPLNLGFGGSCVVLGPTSPSLAKLTSGRQSTAATFVQNLLAACSGFQPSETLMGIGPALLDTGDQSGSFPQNIVATLTTTALVTWCVTRIAEDEGAKIQAPRLMHFEPRV